MKLLHRESRQSSEYLGDERGQALVMTAFFMALLLGFMGLALDVGLLFRAKRNMQSVADAAASAGALDYFYYQSATSAYTAACSAATANGLSGTCGSGTTCASGSGTRICINTPPKNGPNQTSSFVEAIVYQPNPTVLIGTFGGLFPGGGSTSYNSMTVAARAVAGAPGYSTACVYLMDPTMSDALFLKGNGTLSANNCGVYVNSKSSTAAEGNGNTSVNASSLAIVGPDSGAMSLDPNHTVINAAPESPTIPLDLPGIPSTGCTSTSAATEITVTATGSGKITQTAASGSSTNNVVCFTNAVSVDDGVSLPGAANGVLYVFENGVSLSGAFSLGSATASPSGCITTCVFTNTLGAVLDVDGGNFSQNNGQLTIYAPTAGAYNSIALFQPKTNSAGGVHCPASPISPCLLIQRGDSGSVFDGIIFAPSAYVELQDHAGSVYATGLVSRGLFVKASDLVINSYSPSNPITTPFKLVTLVE